MISPETPTSSRAFSSVAVGIIPELEKTSSSDLSFSRGKPVLLQDTPGLGQVLVPAADQYAPLLLPLFLADFFRRGSVNPVFVQQHHNLLRILLGQAGLQLVPQPGGEKQGQGQQHDLFCKMSAAQSSLGRKKLCLQLRLKNRLHSGSHLLHDFAHQFQILSELIHLHLDLHQVAADFCVFLSESSSCPVDLYCESMLVKRLRMGSNADVLGSEFTRAARLSTLSFVRFMSTPKTSWADAPFVLSSLADRSACSTFFWSGGICLTSGGIGPLGLLVLQAGANLVKLRFGGL